METLTTEFYKELYTSQGAHDMDMVLDTVSRKVTTVMNDSLNAPYSAQEVKTTLF